jgi:hypothetical protein
MENIDNLALVGTIKIKEQKVPIYLDKDIKDAFENIELLAKLMNYIVEQSAGRFMYEINVDFNFNKDNETKFRITFEYTNNSNKCLLEQVHIMNYKDNQIDEDLDYDEEDEILKPYGVSYDKKEEIICAINDFANLL